MTAKHFLLSLGFHNITGKKMLAVIDNKLGHCINYNTTCETETAHAKRAQQLDEKSSILPIIQTVIKRIVLTYFWAANFDHILDNQAGGSAINTTHLIAFQERNNNCHYESNLPTTERTKRRTIDVIVNETVVSNIKTNVEPSLIDTKAVIEQNMAFYLSLSILCGAGYVSTIH